MTIQVTGKNIEVGGAFQTFAIEKTRGLLEKYIGPEISGHIRVEKERGQFNTNCSIRLRTGLQLEAHGTGADPYASADIAFERLEKRVRRYKRRLKNHHHGIGVGEIPHTPAGDFVVQVSDEEVENESNSNEPVIIAETQRPMKQLTVSEAVMQLDLTEEAFLVFRNASNGNTNIVYRRVDGNIGWINPDQTSAA
ncbi:MAG: ribosome-associated translation inhibitor RaiA [Hyphomicrobiaceae bacterium]|nr:ribosome-associated translation inhibitor RaiA [Hyphomicrobiaceae bacterium]